MQQHVHNYLPHLNFAIYPTTFVTAVTSITAGTSVLHNIPPIIAAELGPFLRASRTYICCVLNYFLLTENQHIIVLLPVGYAADPIFSPGLTLELNTDPESSFDSAL